MASFSGGARGVRGQLPPGASGRGRQKRVVKKFFLMMERVKGATEA
jgi:hypothetical protein